MEIKRKVKIATATNRRLIIRQTRNEKRFLCETCNQPMLTAEQTSAFLDIKQRRIFQLIEEGLVHYFEPDKSSVLVCPSSLSAILTQDLQSLKGKE